MMRALPRAVPAVVAGLLAGAAPAFADYESAREALGRNDVRGGISTLRAAARGSPVGGTGPARSSSGAAPWTGGPARRC